MPIWPKAAKKNLFTTEDTEDTKGKKWHCHISAEDTKERMALLEVATVVDIDLP